MPALPDQIRRPVTDLELVTNAGWYGCHSGVLAQSSYRWLTDLQSTC